MHNNDHAYLYWKTNAKEFLGYAPGKLVVVGYESGGGFSGAPEVLTLGLTGGIAKGQPDTESVELPPPRVSLEYHIGGRDFQGYHCYRPRRE
jgi:hypothetical protein